MIMNLSMETVDFIKAVLSDHAAMCSDDAERCQAREIIETIESFEEQET